jgi:transcription elongation GreA/GreB family factor
MSTSEQAEHPGLSDTARQRLEQELANLRERRSQLQADRQQLDGIGDHADTAQLADGFDDVAWVDARITELTDTLRLNGENLTEGGAAGLFDGTEVTVRFEDGDEEKLHVVAVPDSANVEDETALTTQSPLGRAIAGHGVGESVSFPTPRGESTVTIVDIKQPS